MQTMIEPEKHKIDYFKNILAVAYADGVVDPLEREFLLEKAQDLDCEILALDIRPEHVHLFLSTTPELSPVRILHRLKGYTARVLRKEFPILMKMPSMWTRSYFVSTAGNVSAETIRQYIEEQARQD